jgi:hypothetical protein
MGVVVERWCPTQQMLGVFLKETEVKKLLLITAFTALALTWEPPPLLAYGGCGSSWQICAYRARIRAEWRAKHPGVEYPWTTRAKAAARENQWLLRHGLPIRHYI